MENPQVSFQSGNVEILILHRHTDKVRRCVGGRRQGAGSREQEQGGSKEQRTGEGWGDARKFSQVLVGSRMGRPYKSPGGGSGRARQGLDGNRNCLQTPHP